MADESGYEVDVHSYTFDAGGTNVFGVPYPAVALTGTGTIDGQAVDCISHEWLVAFHPAYEPDLNDYLDVAALCERFEIELPLEYARLKSSAG